MATRNNYDEHLRLASRDNSVAGNQLGEDTTSSLDTKGKCSDVDEDNILSAFFPREDTTRTAAPYATASSGLIPLDGSLPPKNFLRSCWTLGIRVEPPTSTTLFEI